MLTRTVTDMNEVAIRRITRIWLLKFITRNKDFTLKFWLLVFLLYDLMLRGKVHVNRPVSGVWTEKSLVSGQ